MLQQQASFKRNRGLIVCCLFLLSPIILMLLQMTWLEIVLLRGSATIQSQPNNMFACNGCSQSEIIRMNRLGDFYLPPIEQVEEGEDDPVLPIVMPVCDRPEYLQRVLEGLSRVKNIDKTILVFSQDGENEAVSQLIHNVSFTETVVLKHIRPYLGIPSIHTNEYATSANVKFLIRFALETNRYAGVIVLESDIYPSPDFYDFFVWMHVHKQRVVHCRDQIMSIGAYSHHSREGMDPFELRTGRFQPYGWSLARDQWPAMKKAWTWLGNWDHAVQAYRVENELVCLIPYVSRTRNIGMYGVNFNIIDEEQQKQWHDVHIPEESLDFSGKVPIVPDCVCDGVCELVNND